MLLSQHQIQTERIFAKKHWSESVWTLNISSVWCVQLNICWTGFTNQVLFLFTSQLHWNWSLDLERAFTGDVEAHCGSDGLHTHHFSLHLDVIGFAVSCNKIPTFSSRWPENAAGSICILYIHMFHLNPRLMSTEVSPSDLLCDSGPRYDTITSDTIWHFAVRDATVLHFHPSIQQLIDSLSSISPLLSSWLTGGQQRTRSTHNPQHCPLHQKGNTRLAEETTWTSNQSAAASGGICLRAQLAELQQRSETLDDSKWPKDFSGQRMIEYNVVIFHIVMNWMFNWGNSSVTISDILTACDWVNRTFVQSNMCECLKVDAATETQLTCDQ